MPTAGAGSVPGDLAAVDDDGDDHAARPGRQVSINTGGEKVYPEEVEPSLKAHAGGVRRGGGGRSRRALR